MVLDSRKILAEIKRLQILLKKALQKGSDFEKTHAEVKILCSEICETKSEWRDINIQYPITISIMNFKTGKAEKNDNSLEKKELATKEQEILEKAKIKFTLKAKLELKQEGLLKNDIKEIKNSIKKINTKIENITNLL